MLDRTGPVFSQSKRPTDGGSHVIIGKISEWKSHILQGSSSTDSTWIQVKYYHDGRGPFHNQ